VGGRICTAHPQRPPSPDSRPGRPEVPPTTHPRRCRTIAQPHATMRQHVPALWPVSATGIPSHACCGADEEFEQVKMLFADRGFTLSEAHHEIRHKQREARSRQTRVRVADGMEIGSTPGQDQVQFTLGTSFTQLCSHDVRLSPCLQKAVECSRRDTRIVYTF
jgi:hypothetical protein